MIETQLLDNGISVIYPNWDAPKNVKCFITTRIGGVSKDKYQGLNLGSHVNDDPNLVLKNRSLLLEHLPSEPKWLNQVHGNDVVQIKDFNATLPDCDGAVTVLKKHTLCVLSADCLPIFFSNFLGDIVGVCHAGWKGLLSGVIENTLKSISNIVSPDSNSRYFSTLNVYLGPSISMPHFEVGAELKDAFLSHSRDKLTIDSFESSANPNKYLCNLRQLAIARLRDLNIERIWDSEICCYENPSLLYSYRREGLTGRFGSFIWID